MLIPQVRLTGSLAERAIALRSLSGDVAMAERLLTRLLARPSLTTDEDDPEAIGLWNAAIVFYGRCFKPGRRKSHLGSVTVPDEDAELHEWVIRHRDKYIAHLDPAMELQQESAVLLLATSGQRRVTDVAASWLQVGHPDPDQIDRVRGLCQRMRARFDEAFAAAAQEILDRARQLPVDELYRKAATGGTLDLPGGRR